MEETNMEKGKVVIIPDPITIKFGDGHSIEGPVRYKWFPNSVIKNIIICNKDAHVIAVSDNYPNKKVVLNLNNYNKEISELFAEKIIEPAETPTKDAPVAQEAEKDPASEPVKAESENEKEPETDVSEDAEKELEKEPVTEPVEDKTESEPVEKTEDAPKAQVPEESTIDVSELESLLGNKEAAVEGSVKGVATGEHEKKTNKNNNKKHK
jgi:hypothetical protein